VLRACCPGRRRGGKDLVRVFRRSLWFSPFMTYVRGAVSISNLVDLGLI
jgi:hypothetical protein